MPKHISFTVLTLAALVASPAVLATDTVITPAEAVPAQIVPASPVQEAAKQTTGNPQPNNDSHVDYRYCLDLKTDRGIAECRYKK